MIEISIKKRLAGFTLEVDISLPSESIAVFGPSGSGKSTLLHSVAGLVRPDEGKIAINGEVVFDSAGNIDTPPERRLLGLVPQEGLLFPHLDVKANLLYGFRRVRNRPKAIEPEDVLQVLDIENLLDRYPGTLSGGERQRVALGRALLASPQLLLFDEPLASIDAELKGRILPYLQRAVSHFRIPALYVSHDHSEVTRIASTIVVLSQGKVIAVGPYLEIIDLPLVYKAFTREGVDNILEASLSTNRPEEGYSEAQAGGTVFKIPPLTIPPGSQVSLNVRANDIILACDKPTRISTRNVLAGSVDHIADVGNLLLVHVNVGCELIVELTPEAVRELDLSPGAEVWALIKSNAFSVDDMG